MSDTPRIETARLRLRARTVDDAAALFPSFADPDMMRYWSHGPHVAVEQTREKFAESFEAWRSWAITLHGDDCAIGFVSVGEQKPQVCQIGYMLARPHWGRGIAREAVSAVLDQVFRVERYRRVFADTDPDNVSSNALVTALGFTLEGRLRAEWATHLGIRDTFLWGLLADEWTAR